MRFPNMTLVLACALLIPLGLLAEEKWPQFRGSAQGVADGAKLPDVWEHSRDVAWSVKVPGRGWSSPVVWGDRVFLTTVTREGEYEEARKGLYFGGERLKPADVSHQWWVICLDLKTGKQLWKQKASEGKPTTPIHIKNSYASETPVTDGKRVYAYFGGRGVYCYDIDGKPIWSRPIEPRKTQFGWGSASSPVLYGDQLFVLNDNEEDSYLLCLDAGTGESIWKQSRDAAPSSWATPYVWKHAGRTELIVNGAARVQSYSLDGEELWRLDAYPDRAITIPTPISAHGLLYVGSGYVLAKQKPLLAIKPGAKGDITPSEDGTSEFVAWQQDRAAPYNPSFLVYGDYLYVVYDGGLMSCYEAKTGKQLYDRERLGGNYTASPIASDGRIYCLNEDGKVTVVKAGPNFEILATNDLDEMIMATPAIVGDRLLIRTLGQLYCIRKGSDGEE